MFFPAVADSPCWHVALDLAAFNPQILCTCGLVSAAWAAQLLTLLSCCLLSGLYLSVLVVGSEISFVRPWASHSQLPPALQREMQYPATKHASPLDSHRAAWGLAPHGNSSFFSSSPLLANGSAPQGLIQDLWCKLSCLQRPFNQC